MSKKIVKILEIVSQISMWAIQNKVEFIGYEWTTSASLFINLCVANYVIHIEIFIHNKKVIQSVINVYQNKEQILALPKGSDFMACLSELDELLKTVDS